MVHFNKTDTVYNVEKKTSPNNGGKLQGGKRVRYRHDEVNGAGDDGIKAAAKSKGSLGASRRASFKKLASERIPWKSGFESMDFGGSADFKKELNRM